jgi:mono/diheme cytochrome c family protein
MPIKMNQPSLIVVMFFKPRLLAAAVVALSAALFGQVAAATTARELLADYAAKAGRPASVRNGQKFFTSPHVSDWSCASCHGQVPTISGKHARTGKAIATMAPAVNIDRFTDPKHAEKWFRRNCNDILGRECTAAEKADVIAWLISLKP